jgi:hypothetical protein
MSPDMHKSNLSPSAIENSAEAVISSQAYFTFAIIRLPSLLAENARFFLNKRQAISNHPATSCIHNGNTKITNCHLVPPTTLQRNHPAILYVSKTTILTGCVP